MDELRVLSRDEWIFRDNEPENTVTVKGTVDWERGVVDYRWPDGRPFAIIRIPQEYREAWDRMQKDSADE